MITTEKYDQRNETLDIVSLVPRPLDIVSLVPRPLDIVSLVPRPSNTVSLALGPSNTVSLVPRSSNVISLISRPSNTVSLTLKPSNTVSLVPRPLDMQLDRYSIGESPLESMDEAIELEYEKGVRPLVAPFKKGTGNIKHTSMERYACLLVIHAMDKSGKGKINLCTDGCRSDIMFSSSEYPKYYMGIQVKTTTGLVHTKRKNGNTTYSWIFSDTNKDYSGLLMYMRSLTDGESWLIPFDILNIHFKGQNTRIAKTNKSTKIDWNIYKVNDKNLLIKIYEYYLLGLQGNSLISLKTYEDISRPITLNHQKEQSAREKIIPVLLQTGLQFVEPKLENMIYDFILGDLKFQEKIAAPKNVTGFRVSLYTGTYHIPYSQDDFDILLINLPSPHEKLFYLIPMDKLIEHGIVRTGDNGGKIEMSVYPEEIVENIKSQPKNNWQVEFLCSREDPNLVKRMLAIYNKQLYHKIGPLTIEDPVHWDINCKTINDLSRKWNLELTHAPANLPYTFTLYNKRILEKNVTENSAYIVLSFKYQKDKKNMIRSKGDFDFVYSKMPERYNSFYLIPSFDLENRNILKTDTCKGQQSIAIPFPELGNVNRSNAWVNKFIIRYDDPNFKNTIFEHLKVK